jgi:hypothetical protein
LHRCAWLERLHVYGLEASAALLDLELDALPFLQRLESRCLDGCIVDEYVVSTIPLDEAIALGVVEPLDGSEFSLTHLFLFLSTCSDLLVR